MDFDKYVNHRPYPDPHHFVTIYFYKDGKVIGVREPDGNHYLIQADGSREWVSDIKGAGAAEKVVDQVTFDALRNAYGAEESRIYEQFKRDLFKELGIEGHLKRWLLFEKAWYRGHAGGYSEVYNVALDLVDLIL